MQIREFMTQPVVMHRASSGYHHVSDFAAKEQGSHSRRFARPMFGHWLGGEPLEQITPWRAR